MNYSNRSVLGNGSGIQSTQFRLFEIKIGLKNVISAIIKIKATLNLTERYQTIK